MLLDQKAGQVSIYGQEVISMNEITMSPPVPNGPNALSPTVTCHIGPLPPGSSAINVFASLPAFSWPRTKLSGPVPIDCPRKVQVRQMI